MIIQKVAAAVARVFGLLRDGIADGLLALRIGPNAVTLLGPVVASAVAFAWAQGDQRLGGWLLVAAGATDLIDGTMARRSSSVSEFGGFLDAVTDRYSDLVICAGLFLYFAHLESPRARTFYFAVAFLSVLGSVVPSYVRARSELLIESCKVGYMERGERTVAFFLGAMAGNLHLSALVVAVLGNWVALERVVFTGRMLGPRPEAASRLIWRHARLSRPHAALSAALVVFLLFGQYLVSRP